MFNVNYQQIVVNHSTNFRRKLETWENPTEDLKLLYESTSQDDLDVVVNDQGKFQLKKRGFWDRFWECICGSGLHRLGRLRAFAEQTHVLLQNGSVRFSDPQLQIFYHKGLRKWDRLAFDRAALSPEIRCRLSRALGEAAEAFVMARSAYQQNPHDRARREARNAAEHRVLVEDARAAQRLGIAPRAAGGGKNGASFWRNSRGQPRLVVKGQFPDNGRERLFGMRTQREICGHDQLQSEAVASMASHFFEFDIVPYTDTLEDGSSAQLFDPRGRLVRDTDLNSRTDFDENELELLQLQGIFNYMCGDLDGKDDNWMVVYDDNGRIIDIVKIDNGNSFPNRELMPEDWWTRRKTYAWRNHAWATFPVKIKGKLRTIYNKLCDPQQIDAFVKKINAKYPGFLTGERLRLFKIRIEVIKMAMREEKPMYLLGTLYGSCAQGAEHVFIEADRLRLNEHYMREERGEALATRIRSPRPARASSRHPSRSVPSSPPPPARPVSPSVASTASESSSSGRGSPTGTSPLSSSPLTSPSESPARTQDTAH